MLHAYGRKDEEMDMRRLIVVLANLRTRLKNALTTVRYNSKGYKSLHKLKPKKKVDRSLTAMPAQGVETRMTSMNAVKVGGIKGQTEDAKRSKRYDVKT